MRLDKFLTECGVGTRSEVKEILKSGDITVNGKIEKSPKVKIDIDKDKICFGLQELSYSEFRYYIMHKPSGVITATEDKKHMTVMDILPDWVIRKNLVPVGRLDKDTEGLLLFTNDGKLAHKLLSPKHHVEKRYYVELRDSISDDDIKKLETGVTILDNYNTKESKVEKIDDKKIYLTISEGKFHQVKEMLKAVNNMVIYLKRVNFGNLDLGDLEKNEVIEIKKDEII